MTAPNYATVTWDQLHRDARSLAAALMPRGPWRGIVAVSRGASAPYREHPAWRQVERVQLDREAGDADGSFGRRIAELGADVVVDMICFTPASALSLVEALRGTGGDGLFYCFVTD